MPPARGGKRINPTAAEMLGRNAKRFNRFLPFGHNTHRKLIIVTCVAALQ